MEIRVPIKIKDEDNNEIILVSEQKREDLIIWRDKDSAEGREIELQQILNSNGTSYKIITIGNQIESTESDIIGTVSDYVLQLNVEKEIDKADGIESEENTIHIESELKPYDPRLIRVEPKVFSLQYICDLISLGDIDLSPDFQRGFVWSDITRKSRLIESLLLRIPIPVFYLVQDEEGKFQVVDGVQRLTVIHDFVNNKFKLKNLEYLDDCEGKYFSIDDKAIDPLYYKRIFQTQLTFNIIDPQTPEQVRYDIFRRINTGGKVLNNQEIRNCLEKPHVRKLLKDLSQSEAFKKATKGSISPMRMADREIILRFIAFYLMDQKIFGQTTYKGDMDQYLDSTVDILNRTSESEYDLIISAFERAMKNAYILFGDQAFRKARFINKALFLSWSRVLCNISEEIIEEKAKKMNYSKRVSEELSNNTLYATALSMSTNDVKNVQYNYNVAKHIVYGDELNEKVNDREF